MIQFFYTTFTHNTTIPFPISFDTCCMALSMMIVDSKYTQGVGININNVRNLTKDGFYAVLDGNIPKQSWIAIGY